MAFARDRIKKMNRKGNRRRRGTNIMMRSNGSEPRGRRGEGWWAEQLATRSQARSNGQHVCVAVTGVPLWLLVQEVHHLRRSLKLSSGVRNRCYLPPLLGKTAQSKPSVITDNQSKSRHYQLTLEYQRLNTDTL